MVGDTIVTCYVDQCIRWGKGIAEWRRESSVLRITTRCRRCRGARPTFVILGVPSVGVCLWESPVLTTSEAFCWWGPNHTALVGEERASDGGTHSQDEEYREWRKE